MWFQDKSIFLRISLEHSSPDTKVEYYDCNFNVLECDSNKHITVKLPNKIIIRLSNVTDSEITKVSLSGLQFKKQNLLHILEFKVCKYKLNSINDLEKFPSKRTTKCTKDGYFVINLFHRNPFAIHLYTGNTINFKLS